MHVRTRETDLPQVMFSVHVMPPELEARSLFHSTWERHILETQKTMLVINDYHKNNVTCQVSTLKLNETISM